MQIIFKANDGTVFYSAEECVKYEAALASREKDWEAWGWNSAPTNDTTNAVVVNLPTEDAAAQFLEKAKLDEDDNVGGISEYSRGWYYYDECAEQYFRIDEAIINILKNISAS